MTPHHQKVGQPLLRGWLHAIAALCAFGLVFGLFSQIEDPARRSAMSIFGTSMILMYTVSATYHIGR